MPRGARGGEAIAILGSEGSGGESVHGKCNGIRTPGGVGLGAWSVRHIPGRQKGKARSHDAVARRKRNRRNWMTLERYAHRLQLPLSDPTFQDVSKNHMRYPETESAAHFLVSSAK